MVFYFQNCSDLLWEKNDMVIKKNLWNSKLKAKNLKIFEKSDPLYIIQIKKKLRFRNLQEKLEKYSVSIVLTFQFSDWFFLVILKVLIKFFSITKSLKKFVGFLVETMTAKRHFEIIWPLVIHAIFKVLISPLQSWKHGEDQSSCPHTFRRPCMYLCWNILVVIFLFS